MNTIADIIENVHGRYVGDLKHYYKLVINAPNMYAPYHNTRHMLHVMWEAYDGGINMGLEKLPLRHLLIAAIMHDYDHLGQKSEDSINIDRSIEALRKNAHPLDVVWLPVIESYIRATEFPYTIPSVEIDTASQILRDADQSQTFSVAWIQAIRFGLSKELEMSPKQMMEMQIPYLKNLKFITSWGQNKFGSQIEGRIKEVEQLLELEK
jgi:hypothetical protein